MGNLEGNDDDLGMATEIVPPSSKEVRSKDGVTEAGAWIKT